MTEIAAQPKNIVKSVTAWGGVVALLAAAAPLLSTMTGADITSEDINQGATHAAAAYQAIAGAIGFALVIYGRMRKTSVQPVVLGSEEKKVVVEMPKAEVVKT